MDSGPLAVKRDLLVATASDRQVIKEYRVYLIVINRAKPASRGYRYH